MKSAHPLPASLGILGLDVSFPLTFVWPHGLRKNKNIFLESLLTLAILLAASHNPRDAVKYFLIFIYSYDLFALTKLTWQL